MGMFVNYVTLLDEEGVEEFMKLQTREIFFFRIFVTREIFRGDGRNLIFFIVLRFLP